MATPRSRVLYDTLGNAYTQTGTSRRYTSPTNPGVSFSRRAGEQQLGGGKPLPPGGKTGDFAERNHGYELGTGKGTLKADRAYEKLRAQLNTLIGTIGKQRAIQVSVKARWPHEYTEERAQNRKKSRNGKVPPLSDTFGSAQPQFMLKQLDQTINPKDPKLWVTGTFDTTLLADALDNNADMRSFLRDLYGMESEATSAITLHVVRE